MIVGLSHGWMREFESVGEFSFLGKFIQPETYKIPKWGVRAVYSAYSAVSAVIF